ncbi:hypothetical protein GOODEAATRI_014696 [Goodea atripinnis]|uniref:Uncharacterized protein n=1 Tax=Goodea atripinnis TaxID=208336 RepID=A0ABV0PPA1_9TELE
MQGVTFRVENSELVIARILHGGMIDQQGLLHVGDIIKEVNGKEVDNDPKVLQEMLKEASGSVVLKILPSYQEPHTPRQAFVKCHFDYDPTHDNLIPCKEAEFDRHELRIYEEVAKVPPFRRKTLVLIGAQGVGRRSLKNKLLVSDPHRYGTTTPFTSRKPKVDERDGQMYGFMSRTEMECDIKNGRFLEHGEYDGHYGWKMALSVRFSSYLSPLAVTMLKCMLGSDSELKRTVDESERIKRAYGHYFDLCIVNDGLEAAFRSLRLALEKLSMENQWVPVSWVF